jgi:prolyl oligopeptidase
MKPLTFRAARVPSLLLTLIVTLVFPMIAHAQTTESDPVDPYIWLEEVSSPRAMAWVKSHSDAAAKRLEADPRYHRNYADALEIAGAKDRIPQPQFLHGEIYNFWQDREHLRGIWRKTTLEDYASAAPHWTTVLDIDALNKAEGKSWVFKGAEILEPQQTRCMVGLSDGGEDALISREFDLEAGRFVEGGFALPRGKHRVAWEDKGTLLIATELSPPLQRVSSARARC